MKRENGQIYRLHDQCVEEAALCADSTSDLPTESSKVRSAIHSHVTLKLDVTIRCSELLHDAPAPMRNEDKRERTNTRGAYVE